MAQDAVVVLQVGLDVYAAAGTYAQGLLADTHAGQVGPAQVAGKGATDVPAVGYAVKAHRAVHEGIVPQGRQVYVAVAHGQGGLGVAHLLAAYGELGHPCPCRQSGRGL